MKKADLILRQGVVLPETPRDRRELAALDEDLKEITDRGRPLALRARNFRPTADSYLAAARGPLAYMLRLHDIEVKTADHEERLREERRSLALERRGDPERFACEWRDAAECWSFDEVNELIERHNRWYPVESNLAMDPSTGEFALVGGRDYRLSQLSADWVLERLPSVLDSTL